ncbi:hypothetical protein E2320_012472 [Naja naja]|nr:hypothetical protein E2320_012472 [Naja naja]
MRFSPPTVEILAGSDVHYGRRNVESGVMKEALDGRVCKAICDDATLKIRNVKSFKPSFYKARLPFAAEESPTFANFCYQQ